MEYLRLVFLPFIGAFVGFITNYIAIKLLFWPKKKILGVQGLLPKRKAEIAMRAGDIINTHLINREDIRKSIDREALEGAVDGFLEKNSLRLLQIPFLRRAAKKLLLSILTDRDGYLNKSILESFINEKMLAGIVEQKINEFDLRTLEGIIRKASGPELRFILLSGAFLGLLIGAIEALVRF